ncbi:bifunctional DNA primase/polymerase [Streptomyces sp. AK02-01A]|uniref:bifunctional DNA primase/polymerase n=1 Tax=Streptomyces sp. AK02-01A TaxID=3028648 RepID=UPI0029B1C9CA|nr:bifunctional DNA primase/polymerase [Streptomyces sp. AK02-01A]MDX3855737.1 bifunctional DNA primase/polymerase [Streptomyces sp. AK02-01A]
MATTARRPANMALVHALSAAERGLPVIPLSSTKLPALRSPHRGEPEQAHCHGECGLPGHGVHDATTDPAGVRALFAAAPWATGYGIACGRPPHRLIGIDLDITHEDGATGAGPGSASRSVPDSVAAFQRLALQHLFTVPETVIVLTPSGGRHLWLTGPPDVVVPNSASRLAPGIDVRGAGGYLVGPGSVTARGAYRTAPGTAGLAPAPCPPELLRLLTPPARPHRLQAPPPQGRGLVRFVLAAQEGQRNTRLFWAACRAYENGFGEALAESLVDAAVRTGLDEHEARATIASAARLTAGR